MDTLTRPILARIVSAAYVLLLALLSVTSTYAYEVYGAIGDKYNMLGREGGVMGAPLSDEADAPYGGRFNNFEYGAIYWHPDIGAFGVWGAIGGKWHEYGAAEYGYPITDELPTPDGIGRFNHFRAVQLEGWPEASIYWTPDTGAHTIYGAIRGKWAEMGWENGLGYPITDELGTPDGRGRFNHFRSLAIEGHPEASIYWTPETGAHAIYGAIRGKWAELGWETGMLGYPISDEYQDGGYRRSDFEHGYIRWSPDGGAEVIEYGAGLTPTGGFGGLSITGIQIAVNGQRIAGNDTFLSEPAICGLWRNNLGELNRLLKDYARSTANAAMGDFSIRSDAQMSLTGACSAEAQVFMACDNRVTVRIALPRNLFKFHVTTPTVIGGWADPEFSVDWDMEAQVAITIPQNVHSPLGVEGITFTVSNIVVDSQNVTGDIADALYSVYAYFSGNDIVAQMTQDQTFTFGGIQQTIADLSPAFDQIPDNYRVESCVAGNVLSVNGTDAPEEQGPIVR